MILCDLAGSERMTELINPKEKRFIEMKHINLSLTALGRPDLTVRKSDLHDVFQSEHAAAFPRLGIDSYTEENILAERKSDNTCEHKSLFGVYGRIDE